MIWTLAALGSSALFAGINIVDRRLLSRHFPNIGPFFIWEGIFLTFSALVVFTVVGVPGSGEGTLLAYLSGLIWGTGLMCVFLGFRLEEASRVVAVYQTFPVFVAILALIFLDEVISAGQWVGIVAVVLGAIIISLRGSLRSGVVRFNRALPILIAASLFTGVGLLISKPALDRLPVHDVFVFRSLGMGIVFFMFLTPQNLSRFPQTFSNKSVLLLLLFAELIGSNFALVLVLIATDLGSVSLVSALIATRPVFVFVYSSLLSTDRFRVLNEPLTKDTLLQKTASVTLIVVGIGMVQLL